MTITFLAIWQSMGFVLASMNLMFTPQGLILYNIAFYIPFSVFSFVGYISAISTELDESAKMDGAGKFTIFWRIIFPLIRPATASVVIFLSLWIWNDFVNPSIVNFRRRKFNSVGAVFWMFNDIWSNVRSWSIVDYGLRRTPSFWYVKRAFQPISVAVVEEEQEIVIYGLNDKLESIVGELEYGLFELQGTFQVRNTIQVEIPANCSVRLASFDKALWLYPARSAAYSVFRAEDGGVSRHRLLLPRFIEMQWPATDIQIHVENGEAVFLSETLALGVCIDLDGETQLSDNFFDLYPGMEHRVVWDSMEPPQIMVQPHLSTHTQA